MDLEWRPFYLYFDTPEEGRDLPEHVIRARAAGSEQRLRQIAEGYGMTFHSTKRIYNTRRAHEATEYARDHAAANQFHRIVFGKVYAHGFDISRWEVLRAAALEADLDADDMQQQVAAGIYTERVEDQVRQAYQIGISGVPTYVINNRYAVVGAQPYEVFRDVLQRIQNRNI